MRAGVGLIGVHFISGHFWPGRGKNVVIETRWEMNHVDLGAVLVKASIIKDTRFLQPHDTTESAWTADWSFFRRLLLGNPETTTLVIPQVLFVHQ